MYVRIDYGEHKRERETGKVLDGCWRVDVRGEDQRLVVEYEVASKCRLIPRWPFTIPAGVQKVVTRP